MTQDAEIDGGYSTPDVLTMEDWLVKRTQFE